MHIGTYTTYTYIKSASFRTHCAQNTKYVDWLPTDSWCCDKFTLLFLRGKHFLLRTTAFKYFVQLIFDKSASVLQRLGVKFENLKVDFKTGGTLWTALTMSINYDFFFDFVISNLTHICIHINKYLPSWVFLFR